MNHIDLEGKKYSHMAISEKTVRFHHELKRFGEWLESHIQTKIWYTNSEK